MTDGRIEAIKELAPVVLEVKELVTRFHTEAGTTTAVDGVSLSLRRGETLGLVGESGSGKSATAMSIMGLIDAPGFVESGEVFLDGIDLRKLSPEEMRRVRGNKVSMVFQNPLTALNPALRIGWQLRESIRSHRKMDTSEEKRRVLNALQEVGISNPEKRERAYPHQFSGGMRQRTVIAMGIMNEPGVLVADEPTTALDVTIQAQVLDLLKRLTDEHGLALLLITHNMGVVANMCDRIAVMYAGEIVEEGSVFDVFRNPRHPYTHALLRSMPHLAGEERRLPSIPGAPPNITAELIGCRFRERCKFAEEICKEHPNLLNVGAEQKSRCWVGQRGQTFTDGAEADLPQTGRVTVQEFKRGPTPLLELDNVSRTFSSSQGFFGRRESLNAVDGVSLSVNAGETLGIVGESGSGKSTLARMIVGLDRPTSGTIRLAGVDILERSVKSREAIRSFQMVFQDPAASLNPRLRVGRSIAEPLLRSASANEMKIRVQELLSLVGLRPEVAERYPGQLSGGQQQRICIARVLISNASIVVHDEAVSALDVSVQAQVLNLLADLQEREGLTYVFISHDLAVVRMISTRVAVMYLGKVVEIVPADQLNQELLHPYSIALRSAVPIPDPVAERSRERILLSGDIPSPVNPPSGCRFHTRCPLSQDICRIKEPPLIQHAPERWAACHFAGQFNQELHWLSPLSTQANVNRP